MTSWIRGIIGNFIFWKADLLFGAWKCTSPSISFRRTVLVELAGKQMLRQNQECKKFIRGYGMGVCLWTIKWGWSRFGQGEPQPRHRLDSLTNAAGTPGTEVAFGGVLHWAEMARLSPPYCVQLLAQGCLGWGRAGAEDSFSCSGEYWVLCCGESWEASLHDCSRHLQKNGM